MLILSVGSVGPIRLEVPKDIEVSKTVLYGHNGGGKSCIIRVITMLLCGEGCLTESERSVIDTFKKSLDITLSSNKGFIGFKGEYIAGVNNDVMFRGGQISKDVIHQYIGDYRVARVLTDYVFTELGILNIYDVHDFINMLTEPEFVERVREFFKYLDPGITAIYYRKFRDDGEWLPVELLPYGYKRVIAMLYAIDRYDVVLIEGFEAGLHVDLIREFIDFITEHYKDKVVVIETHLGTLLRFTLMKGWTTYYVSRENIEKLDLQKLYTTRLFAREIEALTR